MEIQPTAQVSAAPRVVPDLRPTADTASLVRNPQPDVPLAVPPSNSQQAVVSAGMISAAESSEKSSAIKIEKIERVLKPYGVNMLPERDNGQIAVKEPETDETEVTDAANPDPETDDDSA